MDLLGALGFNPKKIGRLLFAAAAHLGEHQVAGEVQKALARMSDAAFAKSGERAAAYAAAVAAGDRAAAADVVARSIGDFKI